MIFSEQRSDRIVCFIGSSMILMMFISMAIGFSAIYPRDTWLHRALASSVQSAFIVLDIFALLIWIWAVTKARWTKIAFNFFKAKAVYTFIALTLLVTIWFVTEMK